MMTETKNAPPRGESPLVRQGRRGAALLVVIGLLCLLLIAAMAFSILMNIERSAASNFRHTVQARHLLYSALAQAVDEIDADVGNQLYPVWITTNVTLLNGRSVGRFKDVLQSMDTNGYAGTDPCPARVLTQEALKYIPRSLHSSAEQVIPESLPFTVNGQMVGSYAYVIANVSGQLDVNTVGYTNRWMGTNAGEIQIDTGIPFEISNRTFFATDRTADGRYESLMELGHINTGITETKLANFETFSYAPPELYAPDHVTKKVFIGYDPSDLAHTTLIDQLRAKHTDIVNAFTACGVQNGWSEDTSKGAEWAYLSLLDYAGADWTTPEVLDDNTRLKRPASRDSAAVQAVALIMNYHQAPNAGDPSKIDHSVQYYFSVVSSRPFVSSNATPVAYHVHAEAFIISQTAEGTWVPLEPWDGSADPFTAEDDITLGPMDNAVTYVSIPARPAVTALNTLSPAYVQCFLSIRVKITDSAGHVVDQVPAVWDDSGSYIWLHFKKTFGDYISDDEWHTVWSETLDPTINWNGEPTDGGQWIVSEDVPPTDLTDGPGIYYFNSLLHLATDIPQFSGMLEGGGGNTTPGWETYQAQVWPNIGGGSLSDFLLKHSAALNWWNSYPVTQTAKREIVPDCARLGGSEAEWDNLIAWKRHYMKGAPLDSVGELGYLPIGRWMTINLYAHGHDNTFNKLPPCGFNPVLDYFTLRNPANPPAHGLVNLSSQNPNVHGCVFYRMPIDEWKGPAGASRMDDPVAARNFGQWFVSRCSSVGSVTNLSDLGRFWSGAHLGDQSGAGIANPGTTASRDYPAAILSSHYRFFGEFEREAVVRNAIQLYTGRQQLFTIIVRGDAMTSQYGGGMEAGQNLLNKAERLGSCSAVFQVWRDPAPNANGLHPCFVRLCRIVSL